MTDRRAHGARTFARRRRSAGRSAPTRLLAVADDGRAGAAAGAVLRCSRAADGWGGGEDERPFLPRAVSVCAPRGGPSRVPAGGRGPGDASCSCGLQAGEELRAARAARATASRRPRDGRARDARRRRHRRRAAGVLHERRLARGDGAARLPRRAAHAAAELLPTPRVATDDGSVGAHGARHRAARRASSTAQPRAKVYACGPRGDARGRARAVRRSARSPASSRSSRRWPADTAPAGAASCRSRTAATARLCVDGPVIDAAGWSASARGSGAS